MPLEPINSVGGLSTGFPPRQFVDANSQFQFGDIANITIDGGNPGDVIATDGSGNLSWTLPQAPGGSNSQVQFNANGIFAGSPNFTFDGSSVTLAANLYAFDVLSTFMQTNEISAPLMHAYTMTTDTLSANGYVLTPLVSTTNIIANGVVNLGQTSNLRLYGGSGGQFLQSVGNGSVQWAAVPVTAAGSNTQLQFNNSGSLGASANLTFDGVELHTTALRLPSVATLRIPGGANGQSLITDGNGNLSWYYTGGGNGGGTPGGANSSVQFNNAGAFDGTANLTFDGTDLSAAANVTVGDTLTATQVNTTSLLTTDAIIYGTATATNVTAANVTATGNLQVTGVSMLGSVANLRITGGANSQVLTTYGNGVLHWQSVTTSPAGANTQLQFNNNGAFGASPNLTFDGTILASPEVQAAAVVAEGITVDNLTANTADLGDVANLVILGGDPGSFLRTSGNGELSWAAVTATAGGSNGQVQFNSGGTLLGTSGLFFNQISNTLITTTYIGNLQGNVQGTVTGNVVGNVTGNITGNVNGANGTFTTLTADAFTTNSSVVMGQTTANTVVFGTPTYEISRTTWAEGITADTATVALVSVNAANVSSMDFNITSTCQATASRQVTKMMVVTYQNQLNYTEYGSLVLGNLVGDFTVTRANGFIQLNVTPATANSSQYDIILTTYYQ